MTEQLPSIGGPEALLVAWGAIFAAAACLLFVLGLLWLFVPFALFGIKKRLDRIALALEAIGSRLSGLPRVGQDIKINEPGGRE